MVWIKVLITVGLLGFIILLDWILKRYLTKHLHRYGIQASQKILIRKIINLTMVLLTVAVIIPIWGVSLENLWIYITSILGIVAIGLFATWSILSNIIAGLILLVSRRFRIKDVITVLPDKVSGKIIDVTTMFTVLEDEEENQIYIPNSIIFQKIIKRK